MRILVFEGDKSLGRFLQRSLEEEQFVVDTATEVDQAQRMAQNMAYKLAVIDTDDLDLLPRMKSRNASLPLMVLSARGEVKDRVKGLELGADDYLPKPFAFTELAARAKRLVRRTLQSVPMEIRIGDLEISRVDRSVKRAGKPIDLSPKEFSLLEYLVRYNGQTVKRDAIMQEVWNFSSETMTNVVDVYVSYLRKKIDEGFPTKLISTVRGEGYCLCAQPVVEAQAA